ncbi:hypothetical protein AB3M83_04180 [Microbacterium sp. 179-B 1A2 NHS]|uniref:hypothetical protein n=1 Tax=Microbacterium sp. 179-B 1A2 NHS TaxID=3142383 RepID=UPI0039A01B26
MPMPEGGDASAAPPYSLPAGWRAGERHRGASAHADPVIVAAAGADTAGSRAHLFRERTPRVWLAASSTVAGAAAATLFGAPSLLVRDSAGWLLLFFLPAALAGLLLLVTGVRAFVSIWRRRSSARSRLGVILDPRGITWHHRGGTERVAWTDVRAVRPAVHATTAHRSEGQPWVHLDLAARPDPVTLNLDTLAGPPWLVYTAVRYWVDHPDDRAELGTASADRRMAAWRQAMRTGDVVAPD